jgi:hypothetical protein
VTLACRRGYQGAGGSRRPAAGRAHPPGSRPASLVLPARSTRHKAIVEGVAADVRAVRQAARKADPTALAAVDGAVQRVFEARAPTLGIDREMFGALARDMPPQKVARMALSFAPFRQRFGMDMHDAAPAAPR